MSTSHSKRPTGKDVAEYKNYQDWTYKQWAWQFLRRNAKFQAACNEAGDDDDRQAAAAAEFYLKRFKRYTERYEGDGYKRPLFQNSVVSTWSCDADEYEIVPDVTIVPGQVLVLFDLAPTVSDEEALNAQIRTASAVIRRHRIGYLKAQGLNEPAKQSARPTYFLRSLRLLDLLEHMPEPQALATVNNSVRLTLGEAYEQHRKQLNIARKYRDSAYRNLANRGGKPTIAKHPGGA